MAATPTKTDEVFTRLQPWLPTLQRLIPPGHGVRTRVDASAVDQPCVAWFDGRSFFQPQEEQEPLDSVCEALSLLVLLARVDVKMWKTIIRKIWPSDEPLREWMQRPLPADLVIGFDVTDLSDRWIEAVDHLRGHITSTTGPSDSYTSVHRFLLSLGRVDDAGDSSWRKIRTRIEFGMSSNTVTKMLQHVVDIVMMVKSETENKYVQLKPVFAVCGVDFASTEGVTIDCEGLLNLRQLTWLGVRVSHLLALELTASQEDDVNFTQVLRDIARIDDCGIHEKVGVGSLSISDRFSEAPIEALVTTAQHSPTIHTLEIDLGNGEQVWLRDHSHWWKWVAYSIFSRHADHNIKTLKMKLERLQHVEVDAVREILNAIDPLAAFRERSGNPHDLDDTRQLVASQFYLDNASGTLERPFKTRGEIAVRVLDTPKVGSYPWWSVILPGRGKASVYEDDVISTSTAGIYNVNRPVTTVPEFAHLQIMVSESLDTVADLIELIGQKTKRIDVDDLWGGTTDDAFCCRVLAACSELEELRLPFGNIEDMDVFVKDAATRSVQLQVLHLGWVEPGDRGQDLQGFFGALADPSHPLTMHLQDLQFETILDEANLAGLVVLVVQMLHANRRLLSFHLNVRLDSDAARVLPQWKAALAEFETETVCIRTGPLGVHEKLAFLSVLDRKSRDSASSMGQLDDSVLTAVLQFAANGSVRDLRFTCGTEERTSVFSWSETSIIV